MELFSVQQLLNQVYRLHKGVEKHHNITITVSADPKTLELIAEPNIIKQVLINLLKMHLVPWKANIQDVIVLNGELSSRGRITIRVRVRGLGIPPEHIEKVFIPFLACVVLMRGRSRHWA